MKLDEALELAFESRDSWREGKAAKTAHINAKHVLRLLGEDFRVEETRSSTFAYLTTELKKEGKAASTINSILSVLSTLLVELAQTGYEVPVVKFKRQSVPKGRPGFYKEDEMDLILEAARHRDDYLLLHDSILFALKTGCRQSELLHLTTDKVDLDRREILFEDTKNGSDHWLPMHADLVPVIERRLHQMTDERVFPWESHHRLRNAFYQTMAEVGIEPGRVWHTIRHTTATWMVERGVPLRAIMGVLNHSNVETTLRYAKASDKAVAAAIEVM